MEGIKGSIEALSQTFAQRMEAFEGELKKTSTTQQPSLTSLSSEFQAFREFVMATLKNLELQVSVLMLECDNVEMRSRRAMLLLHGVPEVKDETPANTVLKVAAQHLAAVKLSGVDIARASRLGKAKPDKPRPLLIKFQSELVRDDIWLAKSGLKGTGITMSEFLTKLRHKVFMAARDRLGVNKCWTSAGRIVAVGDDGKRHRITSLADINRLAVLEAGAGATSISGSTAAMQEPQTSTTAPRNKRAVSAKRK